MRLGVIEGERPVGVPKDGMALLVNHFGMFGGPHGAAKAAGVQVGDVIVAFDGQTDLAHETDLIAYSLRTRKTGDKVTVKVVRAGKTLEIVIPMQD